MSIYSIYFLFELLFYIDILNFYEFPFHQLLDTLSRICYLCPVLVEILFQLRCSQLYLTTTSFSHYVFSLFSLFHYYLTIYFLPQQITRNITVVRIFNVATITLKQNIHNPVLARHIMQSAALIQSNTKKSTLNCTH